MEFVKVDSSYVSGTTVPLDTNTKINYRHESGEDVKETDPTGNWFKLGENDGVHLAFSGKIKKRQGIIYFLLFLDEKKQKSTDITEFAKNLAFKRKSFKWKAERFFYA
jgi:hypothetical protein